MDTLVHHMSSWMQGSIVEVDDQLENKIFEHTEKKIMAVLLHLDAFELRVLTWKIPTIDLMTLQDFVASLRADMDAIVNEGGLESESISADPAENMVLATLFTISNAPPPPPRERARRHRPREKRVG